MRLLASLLVFVFIEGGEREGAAHTIHQLSDAFIESLPIKRIYLDCV